MRAEREGMPVIWHQALLALVQRYRADLTAAQKDALRALVTQHAHAAMSPEVKRELAVPGCRGDAPPAPEPKKAGAPRGGFAKRRAIERGEAGGMDDEY
jgi:hypothetical protein